MKSIKLQGPLLGRVPYEAGLVLLWGHMRWQQPQPPARWGFSATPRVMLVFSPRMHYLDSCSGPANNLPPWTTRCLQTQSLTPKERVWMRAVQVLAGGGMLSQTPWALLGERRGPANWDQTAGAFPRQQAPSKQSEGNSKCASASASDWIQNISFSFIIISNKK